jgi:hypothetical protein
MCCAHGSIRHRTIRYCREPGAQVSQHGSAREQRCPCGWRRILCRFGVNAHSSKSANPFRLAALGRLIEGPGRPKQAAVCHSGDGARLEAKVSRRLARDRTAARRPGGFVSGGWLAAITFPIDPIDPTGRFRRRFAQRRLFACGARFHGFCSPCRHTAPHDRLWLRAARSRFFPCAVILFIM